MLLNSLHNFKYWFSLTLLLLTKQSYGLRGEDILVSFFPIFKPLMSTACLHS